MARPFNSICDWSKTALPRADAAATYFDTVAVWLTFQLNEQQKSFLKAHSREKPTFGKRPMTPQSRWRQRVELRGPDIEALRALRYWPKWCGGDCILQRVDIALDLLSINKYRHKNLDRCVRDNLFLSHYRGEHLRTEKGTLYWRPKRDPHNLAVYSDKSSRTTNHESCVHIEWRLKSAKLVRRNSITGLQDLIGERGKKTLSTLRSKICLKVVDIAALGKAQKRSIKRHGGSSSYLSLDDRELGRQMIRQYCKRGTDSFQYCFAQMLEKKADIPLSTAIKSHGLEEILP